MNFRKPIITGLIGLATLIPCKAQTLKKSVPNMHKVETAAKRTIQADVAVRTFQFLNGNNISAIGAGVGKNLSNQTNIYGSLMGGYNFGTKNPCLIGFASLEHKYNNKELNTWLSQELYGEFMQQKRSFNSKIAYTPIKLTTKIKKLFLSFDPRVAFHFNQSGVSPKLETLTTISAPISKKTSGYVLFQTYDTLNLFKRGSQNNLGVNAGISYNF